MTHFITRKILMYQNDTDFFRKNTIESKNQKNDAVYNHKNQNRQ